jgi:phosphoserine phosphatase
MQKKQIIIARHGETVANKNKLILGGSDSPLTERAREMAREFAEILHRFEISRAYTSPLGRAVESANIYCEKIGIEPVPVEALRELSCGDWELRPRSILGREDAPIRKTWDYYPPGGESYADGAGRLSELVDHIKNTDEPGLLLVGHASLNRVLLSMLLDMPASQALRLWTPHHIMYFIQDDSMYAIDNEGKIFPGPLLESLNSDIEP